MAQISDVKEKLLEDPEKIVELLDTYNFCHINSLSLGFTCCFWLGAADGDSFTFASARIRAGALTVDW